MTTTTHMTTAPVPTTTTGSLARAVGIGTTAAVASVLTIHALATAAGADLLVTPPGGPTFPLSAFAVTRAAIIAGIGALIVAFLVRRFARARAVFIGLTSAVLLVSLREPTWAEDTASATWLTVMHLAVAAAIIPITARALPRRGPDPQGDKTGQRQGSARRLFWVKRWMYRGGRPGLLARALNRFWAIMFSAGRLSPERAATLEVLGRRTGRVISFPVVVADHEGERYLVAMLGNANWVLNVRAAAGRAVLRRGRREDVFLEEVDPSRRAPILRRYLAVAPGARPHIPVDRRAPLEAFERIADQFPVFRVVADPSGARETPAV